VTAATLTWQTIAVIPLALGAGLAIWKLGAGGPYAAYADWLVMAALVLAACAAAALWFAWRSRLTIAVLVLALGGLGTTLLGTVGHYTLSERFSVASTVRALPSSISADAPVFAVDTYDHTIPWSLKRTVSMVHYRDELGVAIDWDAGKFVADLGAFAQAWNAAPQAWAFVPASADVERLAKELGTPMQEVARGPTFAIVKKP
jgi:hypothetical protein